VKTETPPLWISFAYSTGGTLALIPSFLIWATLLAVHKLKELDSRISDWCHRPEQRKAWILFSRLGDGWLYALVYLLAYYVGETAVAHRIAASCFLAWGMGSLLKIAVRRKRRSFHRRGALPFELKSPQSRARILRQRLRHAAASWSFPSQHAAVSVAFACALWPSPFAAGLAALICCSRVLVGAHYLGDVLAGVVVGLVAGRLA
jgi:membrane-associated phospholipid phosphatase